MPTRSFRSPLLIALVVTVVLVLHLAVYLGLRIQQGDRLPHAFSFQLAQYILDPSVTSAGQPNIQKNWVHPLSSYNDVPSAQWLVVRRQNNTLHSLALPSSNGKCAVHMAVDTHGQGSVAYSMMRMTGLDTPAPQALRQRLNEYEALHELAHCLYAELGNLFSVPGLTDAENALLSSAWTSAPQSVLVALHKEFFADAYALHKYMEHYTQKNLQQQALKDVELLRVWRAANVQDNLRHRHGLSAATPLPVQLAHAHHGTAPMLANIGSAPDHFMAMPASTAATQWSSRFLVAVASQSSDLPQAASSTFVGGQAKKTKDIWEKALMSSSEGVNSLWPNTNYQTLAKVMASHGWQ